MNHRWKENKCIFCGLVREKKEFKRWQSARTVLVNGVWQDKNYYTYGIAWHYGIDYKFQRPSCKK